jgi:phosphatidylserine/phosphatidylglycerophosphate/cardiolipin synthase-like enzyme
MLRDDYLQGLETTPSALQDLFQTARRTLKVLAPYVDPTIAGLMAGAEAPLMIVTTAAPGRPPRPNPVLERLAATHDVEVRYLNERRDRALIFQMHAKLVLADSGRAYVGSANLTDTSVHYNLELGLLVHDPQSTEKLEKLFDYLFQHVAVRADRLS